MSKRLKKDRTKDLAEELDVFDIMLTALAEILEEKGIITQEEWEKRIREKASKAGGFASYRSIQFGNKK